MRSFDACKDEGLTDMGKKRHSEQSFELDIDADLSLMNTEFLKAMFLRTYVTSNKLVGTPGNKFYCLAASYMARPTGDIYEMVTLYGKGEPTAAFPRRFAFDPDKTFDLKAWHPAEQDLFAVLTEANIEELEACKEGWQPNFLFELGYMPDDEVPESYRIGCLQPESPQPDPFSS